MTEVLKIIFDLVVWVFAPFVLLLTIWYAANLHKRARDKNSKKALSAGFWAGFVLFIIVLIYQIGVFLQIGFPQYEIYQGFNLSLALGGGVIGFVVSLVNQKVVPSKFGGWAAVLITFLSFYSLAHYLLIRIYNEFLLSLILGISFGVLVYSAISPTSLKGILETNEI